MKKCFQLFIDELKLFTAKRRNYFAIIREERNDSAQMFQALKVN